MSALGALPIWRHAAVGTAVVGSSALAFAGLIGAERYEEKFDAKQVTVVPAGEDGVRLREVVDQDFGDNDRRGYQRVIPNDFGVPTDIVASSPDAPDDVNATQVAGGTQIRIGDAETTISGQHRYELSYTLPDARLGTGELALDIIGAGEELATDRFEIVVAGLELEDPLCNVGGSGAEGGCTLEPDGDVYRAVISPLDAGDGITIGGTIVGRSDEPTDLVDVPVPAVPERREVPSRAPLALALLPLGAATGGGVYAWSRRRGRNEVFAGGAADAAYGDGPLRRSTPGAPLPPPSSEPTPRADSTPSTTSVRLVADQEMGALATTEFVPPTGIDPWLGAVVLRETVDNETVSAWFSGLAAREILSIERADTRGKKITLRRGRNVEQAQQEDAALIARLFSTDDEIELGSYDRQFASVWSSIRSRQRETVAHSGYWKRPPAAAASSGSSAGAIVLIGVMIIFLGGASVLTAALGLVQNPVAALAFGAVVTAVAALAAYSTLLPARSATGSAVALRTESFRRFLAASEGRHVEWAWKHGMLREYSAWAVALGAADTWERALEGSSVPPAEYVGGGPLLVYAMASSFSSSHTAPSSSGGGGGGGGFSGGSVGGGGGGGSSGSW